MQDYEQLHNPSALASQDDKIQTAIEVLEESQEDLKDEWAKEEFDFVAQALKEKRRMV